jgi:predicted glutamine amidotransferase
MCRLFGFRSNVPAAVHRSLLTEKNSLRQQSLEHKDGWGIASYGEASLPQVAHGLGAAHADPDFERVSALVASRTVVAHVRLASVGSVELRNAHPFLHGRWSFVHNGTVKRFAQHKAAIEALIRPDLRALMKGATDSERCFYLFLTHLGALQSLEAPGSVEHVARALAQTLREVSALTDIPGETRPAERSSMNFLATDGDVMVATRRHRSLFFSESARRCAEEPPEPGSRLQQLIIASERLCGEDHWHEVPEDGVVGVSHELVLHRWMLDELAPLG